MWDLDMDEYEFIVLGGRSLEHIEAIFKQVKGIKDIELGYADKAKQVEVARIMYNTNFIDLETVLKIFFLSPEATTLKKSGENTDKKDFYRIFYTREGQKKIIEKVLSSIQADIPANSVIEVKPAMAL